MTSPIPVIEDNAHALFAKYKGKYLGTFGAMATQSFHETKNFTCGEGGALVINREEFIQRAEILREKGTNRTSFFRGDVDKYTWIDIGSSFLPSDILAAYLFAQFEAKDEIQGKRKRIWNYYFSHLQDASHRHDFSLPYIPPECDQSYHLFYLLLPSADRRLGPTAIGRSRSTAGRPTSSRSGCSGNSSGVLRVSGST